MKSTNQQNRVWPLLLLMAAIVILPTVCLLWFMTQAVRNERLAVKQKLIDVYQTRCDEINQQMNDNLDGFLRGIRTSETETLPLELHTVADGIVPYREGKQQLLPNWSQTSPVKDKPFTPIELRTELHRRLYEVDKQLKNPDPDLSQLQKNITDAQAYQTIGQKQSDPIWRHALPADLWAFFLQKTIEQYHRLVEPPKNYDVAVLTVFLRNAQTSLAIAERYYFRSELPEAIETSMLLLDAEMNVYGIMLNSSDPSQPDQLALYSKERLETILGPFDKNLQKQVTFVLVDSLGRIFQGTPKNDNDVLFAKDMQGYLDGWQLRLFLNDTGLFDQASRRQTTIYIWTAALVIILIVLAAALAARSLSHQIKLNKLKNDFLATVSHELKTPLSSMRLLVDTLIEGNVKDDTQQRDYLDMIAGENHRLSRLIDNFLTFSRMERNKQSFDFRPANPNQIARDAATAVKTKYDKHHCSIELDITEPLPEIHADHDALVTVLVNLLDNACKYSKPENKQVCLKAYMQDSVVCFQVADNGIGIARRNLKKIFDRFYQVDQTLARQSSGAGLGLSIVKFILDAHRASINVESKPDEGSTFTVKFPFKKH